eukprot:1154892-Pelagomonas_calceolata.AAC.7
MAAAMWTRVSPVVCLSSTAQAALGAVQDAAAAQAHYPGGGHSHDREAERQIAELREQVGQTRDGALAGPLHGSQTSCRSPPMDHRCPTAPAHIHTHTDTPPHSHAHIRIHTHTTWAIVCCVALQLEARLHEMEEERERERKRLKRIRSRRKVQNVGMDAVV